MYCLKNKILHCENTSNGYLNIKNNSEQAVNCTQNTKVRKYNKEFADLAENLRNKSSVNLCR